MKLANLLKIYGNHPISDKEKFFTAFKPPYIIQPKLDGMRVFLVITKDTSIIVNRRGFWTQFKANGLPEGIYDGELVGAEQGPQLVFKNPTITIFDIVEPYGQMPLLHRLKKLEELISPSPQIKLIESKIAQDRRESEEIAMLYMEQGYEGAVIKANTQYFAPNSWLKVKRRETIDLVILAIKKTKSLVEYGIPESFMVGYPDGTKVTDVSSGLSKEDKITLLKHLKPIKEDHEYIYVKPEITLEIEFQEKLKNGLRHPRITRIRWDK